MEKESLMIKRVPFLDLRLAEKERKELLEVIDAVLTHGRIVLGPEVQELEKRMAEYCGRKYAVGVGSGTDALFLGLKSLGIVPGDEVITTSLSWIATANAIALTGAIPVFADICEDLNIDPVSVRKLVGPKTKAILPVHFTGKVCKMLELSKIAAENNLLLIEDAAQAFGATLHGNRAGSFGEIACFSMNQMKIFGSCGDAGMVVTDREDIQRKLIALRHNGMVDRTECIEVSLNGRIDTIHAAILLHRLPMVEDILAKRREIADWYDRKLAGVVELPQMAVGENDVHFSYQIRSDRRDELMAFLLDKGIETQIQHPILMPQQPAYRAIVQSEFPNAERLVKRILCLPNNEKLTYADVEYVADAICTFFRNV